MKPLDRKQQGPTLIDFTKHLIGSRLAIALIGCVTLSAVAATTLFASSPDTISVVSDNVVSEFPEGMRFSLELESEHDIEEVAVRFRVGQQTSGVYEYMEVESAGPVRADLFWRTASRGKYIPPGTIITYNYEIEDVEGKPPRYGNRPSSYSTTPGLSGRRSPMGRSRSPTTVRSRRAPTPYWKRLSRRWM